MTLATTRFTQALLDLEDDEPEVLFEKLPGAAVPLWPQVRMNLALALSETELTSVAVQGKESWGGNLFRAARSFFPAQWDAVGLRMPRKLAFVTSGVTTAVTQAGERNWLIGDFAEAFPEDSAILQWSPIRRERGGPVFPMTKTLDPLRARAEVRSRLRPPPRNEERIRRLVFEFAHRLGGSIPDARLEAITASAVYAERVAASFDREFDAVLDRLRPQIVLFDSPVDGGWGALIAGMKSRGIHVAEPQHGWIGPGHGAYNFGAAMRRPELSVEVPDELLTFGRFWSEGVRYAGRVTTIGKPHFERAVDAAPPIGERPREILVVSSVGEPEVTSDFVLALVNALPRSWTLRFRPHPSERAAYQDRYRRLIGVHGVMVDERTDVYQSLAASRIVLGVASTVLFEAVGMGCRVFVRDTPYVPYIVGDLFGAPLEQRGGIARVVAAARADSLDPVPIAVDRSDLWEPGARANFRRWAATRLSEN